MKSKLEKTMNVIIYLIQAVMSIIFIYFLYTIEFVPMNYIMILGIIFLVCLIGEYFLIFYKKPKSKRSIITQVISVFLSIAFLVSSIYVYKVGAVVDLLSAETFQQRAISVIVLKESTIRNEKQLPQKKLGYISSIDQVTMEYAKEDINKNVGTVSMVVYKDFDQLVNALYDKKVDAIVLDEAFRSLIDQDVQTFDKDTRVIYQMTKEEGFVTAKNVDVLNKPFLVYISGNDMYGKMTTVSRSDVNMLAAINPQTHQILLLSIPRDTYYPLHRNGQYDKFTHAGIYGLQESIDTLEDLLGEDINYYARLNFTSFMNIVDALGGITVQSPADFTTRIGKYHISKGENTLNAKQALAFVRERKSFAEGDFERGKNQQRMISAIVDKICSPAILTSFSGVLDAVSESIETNFSNADINALVQMQLSQVPKWDIQSYQIMGTPQMKPCHSAGGQVRSVVVPYQSSIEHARDYIDQLLDGQVIKTEYGNLNKDEKNK